MSNRKEIHDRVLNAKDTHELMAAYAEWADRYDGDLLDEMGYVAPVIASKLLQEHLEDKDARILDAGCGTGIVGEVMSKDAYSNITGLDYSADMLEKAREKKVYKELSQADLTKPLSTPDDTYDAIISVGTFTCGHVGPSAFGELVRITRPGGYICLTVREQAWIDDYYRKKINELEESRHWVLLEAQTVDYIIKEGAKCKLCLFQVAV